MSQNPPTTFYLETEMNRDSGFIREVLYLLIYSGYSGEIKGLPEYALQECIEKIEQLQEHIETSVKRLMANEKGEGDERDNG